MRETGESESRRLMRGDTARRSAQQRLGRSGLVIGVTALVFAVAAPATGAARVKRHQLSVTSVVRPLTSPVGTFTATGTLAGRPFGNGAIVRRVTTAGAAVSVKFTWFTTRGSVSGTANESRAGNPDGSITFTVTKGRIQRGTGAYRNATGSFSGTGTEPNLNSPVTEHLHGNVKY